MKPYYTNHKTVFNIFVCWEGGIMHFQHCYSASNDTMQIDMYTIS